MIHHILKIIFGGMKQRLLVFVNSTHRFTHHADLNLAVSHDGDGILFRETAVSAGVVGLATG